MASFTITNNQTLRAGASLAAATTATANLDLETSGPLAATLVVSSTPGASVTAGAQLTVNVLVSVDGGTTYDTVPVTSVALPSVASTLASVAISLAGGLKYQVQFVNTDATNAITTVGAVYSKITGIS
jgi:hypothetical protein